MVLRHLRIPVDLPTIVAKVLGTFRDETAWPQDVYIGAYKLNCLYLRREQLLAEGSTVGSVWVGQWLRADWALQPYIQWNDGSGAYHTIVLGGVYADGRVRILDPASGEDSIHTFEDMMQGYGHGTVVGLWYDIGYAKRDLAFRAGPPEAVAQADE